MDGDAPAGAASGESDQTWARGWARWMGGDDTTAELPAVPGSPEPARLLQHGLAAR